MDKLEKALSSVMEKAGAVVENIASTVSRPPSTKPKKTGLVNEEGDDFGEIRWNQEQLQSLLGGIERRMMNAMLGDLQGKRVLQVSPNDEDYREVLLTHHQAAELIEVDVRKTTRSAKKTSAHPVIRASIEQIPFPDSSFDFILYPSALAWRADLPLLITEASRCLKDSGRFLFSTIHPFFEYLLTPKGGFHKSFEHIFSSLRKSHLFLEGFKEGVVDEALRLVTLPKKMTEDLKHYPGLPVVLAAKAIRVKRRKSD